ncbi:MAG: hypothetical protein WBV82_20315 [Myxococcaceae bacterium]
MGLLSNRVHARLLFVVGISLAGFASATPLREPEATAEQEWGWRRFIDATTAKPLRAGPWAPEEPAAKSDTPSTAMVRSASSLAERDGLEKVMPPPTAATPTPPFYRGTTISYRNMVSALTFNPAAEPTYNPYYAMQLSIAPRAWLSQKIYARASFDVASELTQNDSTTDRFVIGDLGLGLGAAGFYTLPWIDLDVSSEVSLSLPTSEASQASTRVLGMSASVSLARKLGTVTVSYAGNFDTFWNRYTTGAPTTYLYTGCEVSLGSSCADLLVYTGRRNASFALSNGLTAVYAPTPRLSFTLSAGLSHAFLYPLADSPEISLEVQQTSDVRYSVSTSAGASFKATEELTVGMSVRSAYAQQAPDGSYRMPLINRFTQFNLELGLNIAGLVARLRP